jgi:hypothetical protein
MADELSASMPCAFAMLPLAPGGPVLQALRAGSIEPEDLATLWALIAHLNWRSGRYWGDAAALATAMGQSTPEAVELALGRLRQAGLVACGRCRRRPAQRGYWCVLPAICTTGGPYRRRRQWLAFHAATEDKAAAEAWAAATLGSRRPFAS